MGFPQSLYGYTGSGTIAVIAWNINIIMIMEINNNIYHCLLGISPTLYSSEKEGGAPRHHSHLQAFQDTLTDCLLEDIGYNGDKFTWFRGGLRERLDRAVSNAEWMEMHPMSGLSNLEMGKSDHCPICLDTEYLAGVAAAPS